MLTRSSVLRIFTPVYFFRPQQIFSRVRYELSGKSQARVTVRLPWGLPLIVSPREAIGYNIATQGVYEPLVAETLWRLAVEGEWAGDVGANIGYMSSVLAARVGSKGRVLSFEPHPEVFSSLQSNVAMWERNAGCAPVELHAMAIGSEDGATLLRTNDWFASNKGTAWIGGERDGAHPQATEVRIGQLDTIFLRGTKIGVLKVDVEGNELEVFRGMARLLEERAVRDIVFEELTPFPAPTHQLLKDQGYSIFGLDQGFWGVHVLADATPSSDAAAGPNTNYLATCDPGRALRLLTPPGWRSFGWTKTVSSLLANGAA